MRFRSSDRFFGPKMNVIVKVARNGFVFYAWRRFSESITAGRCETKKFIRSQARFVHGHELAKWWNLRKSWSGRGAEASKSLKIARWRDFNALRRAHVLFQVIRRILTLKSNCVDGSDCSTTGGRTAYALSIFGPIFRTENWSYCKICQDRLRLLCVRKVFWKYHGWTLRNKKVRRAQATFVHGHEIAKWWNFRKYWSWRGVEASNSLKIARWREFNALRRAHVLFQVTRRGHTLEYMRRRGRLLHDWGSYSLCAFGLRTDFSDGTLKLL